MNEKVELTSETNVVHDKAVNMTRHYIKDIIFHGKAV